MNPFFSVVIPFYNNYKLFENTLISLNSQIFKNFEVIIVHGSQQKTFKNIIDSLKIKLDFVTFLNDKEVPNANVSRNIGIKYSKGDFIAFLDSDDFWECNRLQKVYDYLNSKKPKAIYSGCIINYSTHQIKRTSRNLNPDESVFDFLLRQDTISQTSSMVVENEIARKIKFDENLNRHQDFDFFIRINEVVSWEYFEDYSVIVNQNYQKTRPVAYEHCLPFYSKYHHLSIDSQIRHNYIFWIVEKSAKENPDIKVSRFFKKKLIGEKYNFTLRQKLLFNYPHLFNLFYRIKRKLI